MVINHIPIWYIRRIMYRLLGLKIGKNSKIALFVTMDSPWKITLGVNTLVNEMCYLDGRGELMIGDNVSVSQGASVITASHGVHSDTFEYFEEKVLIEDNVWIATGAIVLNGSHLRNGSVIGAGSVFKGSTEPNTIYAGNPAKAIKRRKISEEFKQKLDINFL